MNLRSWSCSELFLQFFGGGPLWKCYPYISLTFSIVIHRGKVHVYKEMFFRAFGHFISISQAVEYCDYENANKVS